MVKKTLRKIRGTRVGYNIGRAALSSPLVNKSKVYHRKYDQKIRKNIKNGMLIYLEGFYSPGRLEQVRHYLLKRWRKN